MHTTDVFVRHKYYVRTVQLDKRSELSKSFSLPAISVLRNCVGNIRGERVHFIQLKGVLACGVNSRARRNQGN